MKLHWIILVFLGLLATAAIVGAQPRGAEIDQQPAKAGKRDAVKIKGKIENLYPGRSAKIKLRLHNRTDRPLRVKKIRAKVGSAGPGCSAKNLKTKSKKLNRRIPPRATRKAKLPISMSANAADACQGAKFPLRYRAKVKR